MSGELFVEQDLKKVEKLYKSKGKSKGLGLGGGIPISLNVDVKGPSVKAPSVDI